MKIAFLLDTFPSLTETFIARDIEALRRHGLDIEVFALHPGVGAKPLSPAPSVFLIARGAWGKLTEPGQRSAYFKALGAAWWQDLVASGGSQGFQHIHAGWASHPAYIAWGAAEKANLTWSFSGHAHDIFVGGGDLKGKLAAAQFASVCTRAAANHLKTIAPQYSEKILYAPHGIEASRIEFGDWNVPSFAQLLAVGRLVEKKGFSVFLEACAILQAQNFPFAARIIGEGPLRESLVQRRDRLNLHNSVYFTGAVKPEEVLPIMSKSSCLVVPALIATDGDRDGLPNVILEAAACGLPIVATRTGAIEEFVDKTTGFLCKANRAEDLAAAIVTLFAERDQTEQLRHAARQRVEREFDLMQNAAHLATALQNSTAR